MVRTLTRMRGQISATHFFLVLTRAGRLFSVSLSVAWSLFVVATLSTLSLLVWLAWTRVSSVSESRGPVQHAETYFRGAELHDRTFLMWHPLYCTVELYTMLERSAKCPPKRAGTQLKARRSSFAFFFTRHLFPFHPPSLARSPLLLPSQPCPSSLC